MSKKYRQAFRDTMCWCYHPDAATGGIFRGRKRSAYERSGTYVTYTHGSTARYASKRLPRAQPSAAVSSLRQNPHRQLSDDATDDVTPGHWTSIRNDAIWRDRQAHRLSCHGVRSPRENGDMNRSLSADTCGRGITGDVSVDVDSRAPVNGMTDYTSDVSVTDIKQVDVRSGDGELELTNINMAQL